MNNGEEITLYVPCLDRVVTLVRRSSTGGPDMKPLPGFRVLFQVKEEVSHPAVDWLFNHLAGRTIQEALLALLDPEHYCKYQRNPRAVVGSERFTQVNLHLKETNKMFQPFLL